MVWLQRFTLINQPTTLTLPIAPIPDQPAQRAPNRRSINGAGLSSSEDGVRQRRFPQSPSVHLRRRQRAFSVVSFPNQDAQVVHRLASLFVIIRSKVLKRLKVFAKNRVTPARRSARRSATRSSTATLPTPPPSGETKTSPAAPPDSSTSTMICLMISRCAANHRLFFPARDSFAACCASSSANAASSPRSRFITMSGLPKCNAISRIFCVHSFDMSDCTIEMVAYLPYTAINSPISACTDSLSLTLPRSWLFVHPNPHIRVIASIFPQPAGVASQ